MNFEEQISWLATTHSGKCYPKRLEDIDTALPYFKLSKDELGKYKLDAFNYETHDNAPRMPFVAKYLMENVLPLVKGDLSGYYNIQLHDNYSYLNDKKCYNDVLCFGGMKNDMNSRWTVQLPDCYFMGNWGGKYDRLKDDTPWEDKKSKIIFAGTSTGSRIPSQNLRIKTCVWALDKGRNKYCDFWITNIAQMDARQVFTEVPQYRYISRPHVSLNEQMTYRYMLGIDGNTCRWNPDVCFMNTVSLCLPSKDMLWYSPLFIDGEHYAEVTTEENTRKELLQKMMYFENNWTDAWRIIKSNNDLARILFKPDVCQKYTVQLFENIAENK